MKNYNITRSRNLTIVQSLSNRPGLHGKHALEVALGEAVKFLYTVTVSGNTGEVFRTSDNREYLVKLI